jgi:hypothetical protein
MSCSRDWKVFPACEYVKKALGDVHNGPVASEKFSTLRTAKIRGVAEKRRSFVTVYVLQDGADSWDNHWVVSVKPGQEEEAQVRLAFSYI